MPKIKIKRSLSQPAQEFPRESAWLTNIFEGWDFFDQLLYVGVFLVTLIIPFLYSRLTTENFLTPKEFTCKIAMGVLLVILSAKFAFRGRIELKRTSLDLPLVLFLILWVLSIAWNYNVPSAIRDLRGCFLIILLYPLIINVIKKKWEFDGILWAMVIAGVCTSILGILEAYNLYFRWDPKLGWWVFARDEIFSGYIDYNATYIPLFPQLASKNYDMASIVSTFGNRNYLGTFAMFTAFIPLAFCFYYRTYILKGISLFFFAIMVGGLIITRCRAALIGLVVGIAFLFLMILIVAKDWRFVRRYAGFFLIVGTILMAVFFWAATTNQFSMLDKLFTTFTLIRQGANTYERLWVWYATYQSFAKSPFKWLLGSGFGSYKHFFPLQEADTFSDQNKETFTSVTFRQAHNDWLQLISELGLVGLAIFIWIVWRFYRSIYLAIKEDMDKKGDSSFSGDHILALSLGSAMFSQLIAAIPDFPFHRIETALYCVIVMSLVPLFSETCFFQKKLPQQLVADFDHSIPIGLIGIVVGLMAIQFERVCWKADILVRDADLRISTRNEEQIRIAREHLQRAIDMDRLPGDPYLKMATITELTGDGKAALEWCQKAWKNINFNARSTYHSVVFRVMHTLYHVLGNPQEAMKSAEEGLRLTCSEARSIYYFYIGRIALDLGQLEKAEQAFERAMKFSSFFTQAGANLALVLATMQKWQKAYEIAATVSASIGHSDPTLLDIMGISASNLGMHDVAIEKLTKAIELKSDQPIYKRDLGIAYLRKNMFTEARKKLEEAHADPALPSHIKQEVETLLASISVFIKDMGKKLIETGNYAEGVNRLKEAQASPFLPESAKNEIASYLFHLKQLPAEYDASYYKDIASVQVNNVSNSIGTSSEIASSSD